VGLREPPRPRLGQRAGMPVRRRDTLQVQRWRRAGHKPSDYRRERYQAALEQLWNNFQKFDLVYQAIKDSVACTAWRLEPTIRRAGSCFPLKEKNGKAAAANRNCPPRL
jgi:hypothetical protein